MRRLLSDIGIGDVGGGVSGGAGAGAGGAANTKGAADGRGGGGGSSAKSRKGNYISFWKPEVRTQEESMPGQVAGAGQRQAQSKLARGGETVV